MKKLILLPLLFVSYFLAAQNVGIGTTTPQARLHITDSAVLFSAAGDIPVSPGNVPLSSSGRRMMWYPDKAAFRAGYVDGTQWDKDSIGAYSFAAGYLTKAKGVVAVALGNKSVASGTNSVALGADNLARGDQSTAIGNFTIAAANYTTAIGYGAIASGFASTAIGYYTTAPAHYSTALGFQTTASGQYSTAMGDSTIAKAYSSLSIGGYNDNTDNPDPITRGSTDRIFQVGNGMSLARSNALTVLRNGNMGIGHLTPIAPLSFSSIIGQKVTFYGDSYPSYGIGIQPFLLQIHTDGFSSDIAFGYGSSASLTERMRIKGNGNVGIGTSTPQSKLEVNGYTMLGSEAPKIKMKKMTGTTAASQGGFVSLMHGLTSSQILSVEIFVEHGTNFFVPANYRFSTGFEVNFNITPADLIVSNVVGNSSGVLSKPFKVLITYEE